jgi:phosphatidylglycerol:prolipoprotein diacylglycerol transferase
MCSELFRIPLAWKGVPLWGCGALFWIGIAVGLASLRRAARQEGWSAAAAAQLPSWIVVAAVIGFLPRYFPGGVPIRGYGLMVLCGASAGIVMALRQGRRWGVDESILMGVAGALFAGGLVGARLFYVVEYWDARIRQLAPDGRVDWPATIKQALSYTEGGLVIYGAFLGAMAAFAWYCRRRRLNGWALADLIAPSMLAGLALGRIGCLLNGCCYGGETSLPWAVTFPQQNAPQTLSMPYRDQAARGRFHGMTLGRLPRLAGAPGIVDVAPDSPAGRAGLQAGTPVLAINGLRTESLEQAEQTVLEAVLAGEPLRIATDGGREFIVAGQAPPARSLPVHPAQIYSALSAAMLAWLLWEYYPFRKRDGQVVTLMLLLHPIDRFLLEIIRIDELPVFGTGMSISQNISLVLFALALVQWVRLQRRPAGQLAFQPATRAA